MEITAYDLAQRFIGIKEVSGPVSNPMILAMLQLDDPWPHDDEVPWCSAFMNYICWLLRLPRSKSLAARSWLNVGRPIDLDDARIGNDVVVFKRTDSWAGAGHVGFLAGDFYSPAGGQGQPFQVQILGGNQNNQVSVAPFAIERILGIRRLA